MAGKAEKAALEILQGPSAYNQLREQLEGEQAELLWKAMWEQQILTICQSIACASIYVERIDEQTAVEDAIDMWNTRAERTCVREKHGVKMDGSPRLRCSLCGYGIGDKRFNYCPKCGAKVVSE